ncbi:DEAD/DEAH box helicase family protein [Halomonas sp. MMSF_3323]|uniref:DEAD/DEAH box helicase family protein n=1 Tax=Halomonas sp. MMSF_3323 TaxID=3046701 RepID=UPI0027402BA9|nr:DEAD/DEAH box helicase family protein [Halomonas sp. MMSF_3323]
MASQFSFAQKEFADVYDHAHKAELLARSDPRSACFYARLALEVAVKWMYRSDGTLRSPYQSTLSAHIHEPTFRSLVGSALVTKAKIIKDHGNMAVHEVKPVPPYRAITAVRELFHFTYWLVRTYASGEKPATDISFSADALPATTQIESNTLQKLQETERRYVEAEKARALAEKERLKSEGERLKVEEDIKALRAEIDRVKKANLKIPDDHDYNEAQTRDAFIDLLLAEAGWSLDDERDTEFPVTGMPNKSGEGFVDYVLWGNNGKPLALVEAKRTKRDAREGQRQAELYANALEKTFGQRPVIFYSNGYEHWLWDDMRYPPRPVQGFLKQDELELLIQRRSTLKPLAPESINGSIVERYYQTRAIRRIAESFEKDKMRKSLLVMATGSGKTRTVIALTDLLMRANWSKRILFLADRVALVNQATNAFKKFLPHSSPVNLIEDNAGHGRIYVSTYPTMMRLIDQTHNGVRRFGAGHFDLIVIDEAHRSVYRKYKAIFDYFDSFLVGLTATPKDDVDRDTYALFNLERGIPTDAYDLDQAVDDGYLVPPKAVSVPLRFMREGIKYDDLSEEEKEAWDAIEWDEEGSVPDQVDPAAVNKWLFNEDTVDKVLEHLMTHGLKVADGDRLGKTIVFAKNHDHAQFIAERFDANYPHLAGKFARVIDFKTEYAQSLIDDFSEKDKSPHIAISVDMLDTGIDIPEAVNLVFFKIVRSKTKFWQMLGRGTRLCPDLFGPGEHKEEFYVFDFCQNFEFFKQNPDVTDGAGNDSLSCRLFASRVNLASAIQDLQNEHSTDALNGLRSAVVEHLRTDVLGMNIDNFEVRPKRRLVEKFQSPEAWQKLGLDERSELIEELAGLPTANEDDELEAKQFDLLILRSQLALLQGERNFEGYSKKIRDLAGLLEEKRNVPMVADELDLILELQTDEFWQDITAPILDTVRRRLRRLIKLIEVKKRPHVYTNFEDELGEASEIEALNSSVGTDMHRFRLKVRHFLTDHMDHITIQKLRRNEPLTSQDLEEMERILIESGTAEREQIEKLEDDGGLGLFIRSMVGLDRTAAKKSFNTFIEKYNPGPDQIEFLNMVIDYLTERGVMDPRTLYESPFTDLDSMGIEGVFSSAEVVDLLSIIGDIKSRTAA